MPKMTVQKEVVRDPDDLLISAKAIIRTVFQGPLRHRRKMFPLFSGGYDSLCACYCASQTEWFEGSVYHINTGIGARQTREYVDLICAEMDWKLIVLKSNTTYEQVVAKYGFPGPAAHGWTYQQLKDRCISSITAYKRTSGKKSVLISGARQSESTRRMGTNVPVKIGETLRSGEVLRLNRIWASPCYDWTDGEQVAFRNAYGFPVNPVKEKLGMSGECFCGAFATPNELQRIEQHVPDVADKIRRISLIAEQNGVPSIWGCRPNNKKGIVVAETGPMCSSCDRRALAAGIIVKTNC